MGDAKPRWRRLLWTPDSQQLAAVSGDGDLLLVSARDLSLVARASAIELGVVDGVVDATVRVGDACELEPDAVDARSNELLLLTSDGFVRRVHAPHCAGLPLHPLCGAMPGERARDACVDVARLLPLHEWQFMSTSVAVDASGALLAVGGGERDAAFSSVVLWQLIVGNEAASASREPLCAAIVGDSGATSQCMPVAEMTRIASNWPPTAAARLHALADSSRTALMHCLRFAPSGVNKTL